MNCKFNFVFLFLQKKLVNDPEHGLYLPLFMRTIFCLERDQGVHNHHQHI